MKNCKRDRQDSFLLLYIIVSVIAAAVLLALEKPHTPPVKQYKREVAQTDTSVIYRTYEYRLISVRTDTVPRKKRVKSTLELPH
jgi:hypothetical protein